MKFTAVELCSRINRRVLDVGGDYCYHMFGGDSKTALDLYICWRRSTLVSTTLQNSLRKLLGFHRQWYRVLAIVLTFFTFFFEEKINDRVDQNPMATGTVGPIKI